MDHSVDFAKTHRLGLHRLIEGIVPVTPRLLDLPDGLNFTKIVLSCADETDSESTTVSASGCPNTLEQRY